MWFVPGNITGSLTGIVYECAARVYRGCAFLGDRVHHQRIHCIYHIGDIIELARASFYEKKKTCF